MLQAKAVAPATLELIKALQNKNYLKEFYLVGGTALALYYEHRQSIDIDLFTKHDFNTEELLEQIHQDFSYQINFTAKNTLKGSIDGINVDIISHRYPYLQKPRSFEQIALLAEPDLIAMKLNAISISGQRSKDFIDIYYALDIYSMEKMIEFYKTKYSQESAVHVLKSLTFFDDINLANWPVLIKEPDLKWESVKEKLQQKVVEIAGIL